MSEWASRTLQRRPRGLRTLIRLTEPIRPRGTVFGRAREVQEIFDRSHDFQLGLTIAPKWKLEPFLLSMDEGPRHTREKRALIRALDRPFQSQFHAIAKSESERQAALVAGDRSRPLDLGSAYAEPVFARTLARYFGLPTGDWSSNYLAADSGEQVFALFIRTLGATLGCGSSPAPFGLEALALGVAEEFRQQLDAAIDERTAVTGDTVLGYLLDPRPEPGEDAQRVKDDAEYVQKDGLARSIGGLLSAGASFPKAFASVQYELSQRKLLDALVKKANDSQLSDDAWATLVKPYVLEALRFRPPFPLLARACPRAAKIGKTELAAGSTLGFSPLAAMFDPEHVNRPEEFNLNRPDDRYFIFGGGPRTCIGRDMMLGLFPPLLRSLFKHIPEIASAGPGRFRYDGAALESYYVG